MKDADNTIDYEQLAKFLMGYANDYMDFDYSIKEWWKECRDRGGQYR